MTDKINNNQKLYYGSEEEELLMSKCYNMYVELDSLIYHKVGILENIDQLIGQKIQLLSCDPNNIEQRNLLQAYKNDKLNEESKLERVVEFMLKLARYQNIFISQRIEEGMLLLTDHAPRTSGMLIVEGDRAYYGIDKYHLSLILKSTDMLKLVERARTNVGLLRDHKKIESLIEEFNNVKNEQSSEPDK